MSKLMINTFCTFRSTVTPIPTFVLSQEIPNKPLLSIREQDREMDYRNQVKGGSSREKTGIVREMEQETDSQVGIPNAVAAL